MTEAAITQGPRKPGWNDVVFTVVHHGPKGDVVTKIVLKKLVGVMLIIAGMVVVIPGLEREVSSWVQNKDREAILPRMEALANEGKDHAALWLIRNDFRGNAQRLPALVAKGNPEALFIQGLIKMNREDDGANGFQLIKQAAAQGYEPAVKLVEQRGGN